MENQYVLERILKSHNKDIVKSVENKDTIVKVNEPDQNTLNYMIANSYEMIGCYGFGNVNEGLGYDLIFKIINK